MKKDKIRIVVKQAETDDKFIVEATTEIYGISVSSKGVVDFNIDKVSVNYKEDIISDMFTNLYEAIKKIENNPTQWGIKNPSLLNDIK